MNTTSSTDQLPVVGDVVCYVLPSPDNHAEPRAALVTGFAVDDPNRVHLVVFSTQGMFWALDVTHSADPYTTYTWHWPPHRVTLTDQARWFPAPTPAHALAGDLEATGQIPAVV